MNRDLLRADLERDEGLRLKPYKDTAGKLTIGVGRNLTDVGITHDEALLMLNRDIEHVVGDLELLPWWPALSEPRQRAVANMAFNLGLPRFLNFQRMLGAIQAGKWKEAASEALDSTWATQVGDRAKRIAKMLEEG